MLLTKGQWSCNESKCNIYQSCEFTKFCCQDGKFKEILFFRFLGFSCSFTYKLLVGRHGDMRQCREWPRCVIQWCCGALRCRDLCTSSRLDVAAPGTWHRHGYVCVCASGVARISTDGFLHTMRVQRRFVVFISIHIYYIPCIVPGRDGAEDSKNKPWLWKFNGISNAMKEWCRKVHQWMRKWLWRCWWHEAKTMTRNNRLTGWRNERLN